MAYYAVKKCFYYQLFGALNIITHWHMQLHWVSADNFSWVVLCDSMRWMAIMVTSSHTSHILVS